MGNTCIIITFVLCFYICLSEEIQIEEYSNIVNKTDQIAQPLLSNNGGTGRISLQLIHAKMNTSYNENTNLTVQFLYEYVYNISDGVLRIYISVNKTNQDRPVFFVAWQRRDVTSWELPLLEHSNKGLQYYYDSSNILCPVGNYPGYSNDTLDDTETLYIGVTTSSLSNITFQLTILQLKNFNISLNEVTKIRVSPSEPVYYEFQFPDYVNTVLVKVTSNDGICMTVSLQNISCPVFDSQSNVEFEGIFQTMYSKGGITVTRSKFPDGFYVVFVVKPDDTDCYGVPTMEGFDRIKRITLTITEKATFDEYIAAVFGAVAIFVLVFLFTVIISCIYYVKWQYCPVPDELIEQTFSQQLITPGGSDYGYGTFPGPSSTNTSMMPASSSPILPRSISNPSLNSAEYDMLADAYSDKDVFRCNPILYVTNLARKTPRTLAKKSKQYLWSLLTVAVFYALPVIQLVVTYQRVLNTTGNEDLCYYNFLCAHPLGLLTDFNHVFSNIGYVILGLLFIFLTWRKELMYKKILMVEPRLEQVVGIPHHFGLFYAIGVALIMEGVLSGCYHVCPNHSNFQFDTSFMYMIAVLCMLKIYQSRHPDINANAHITYGYMAIFIFIGVVGVLAGTQLFWIVFTVFHILVISSLSINIYYMGRWKLNLGIFKRVYIILYHDAMTGPRHLFKPLYWDRFLLLTLANLINWGIALQGVIIMPMDFAFHMLCIFITNLMIYTTFYILMKLRNGEKILVQPLIYILASIVCWVGALYFFFQHITSTSSTPAQSRAMNEECIILGFYDSHDIWHFLSAASMFFSFMILLTLDDDLIFIPRTKIVVF